MKNPMQRMARCAVIFAATIAGQVMADTTATPPTEPETFMVGACLLATVTENLPGGAQRVRWTHIDAPSCRQQDPALKQYTRAAAGDVLSTALALSRDGLVEGNPLGLGPALGLKAAGWVALAMTDPSPSRTRWAGKAAAVQWGATASNLCMLTGAAMPACYAIGLSIGVAQWPE